MQMIAHKLDLGSIHVGHGHGNGGRQVDDDLFIRGGFPDVDDFVADPEGKFHLRAGEAFRGILKTEIGFRHFRRVFVEEAGPFLGDFNNFILAHLKDLLPLGQGGRVIQMNDSLFRSFQRLEGLLDDVFPGLGQHLDGHVIGNQVVFDQCPEKGILGFRGGREPHFDFLETQLYQELKIFNFLLQGHGDDQSLVAIPQIDAAPDGSLVDMVFFHPFIIGAWGHEIAHLIPAVILHFFYPF